MKRFTFVLALLALMLIGLVAAPAFAQDETLVPNVTQAVEATPAPTNPTPAGESTSDEVPQWLQLVLDNIEWIFGTVAFILIYRSVPPGAFEKGLKNAKEGAALTVRQDDDKLVAAIEGIYNLVRGLQERMMTLVPEQTPAVQATVPLPVKPNSDGTYTVDAAKGLQDAADEWRS